MPERVDESGVGDQVAVRECIQVSGQRSLRLNISKNEHETLYRFESSL